jgi:O-antigen ligase
MQTLQTQVNLFGAWLSRVTGMRETSNPGQPTALSAWLALVLGGVLGVLGAYLVIMENWVALAALLLVVPMLLLFFYYPFITVIGWLLVFPFFISEALPGSRPIYWLLHRAMIPGALLALCTLSILGIRKIRNVRLGLVDGVMIAYVILCVINILMLTARPNSQLIHFYDRIAVPFCMYWVIRVIRPGQIDLERLAPVAFTLIFSQGIIGVLSWFAPQVLPPQWLGRLGERTVGTFGNPAVFTTTLLFAVVILTQTVWRDSYQKKLQMAVSFLAVAFAFFLVFFSFSRGSWLGAVPVWLGLYMIHPKWMRRLSLVGSIALVPLLALGPLAEYSSFAQERLFTETTAEGRVIGGAATFRMIQEKPVFGWGYRNHELYDEQFRDRVLGLVDGKEQSSHNTYLLIAAEMGILGLILYYLPIGLLLYMTVKYWRRLPSIQIWSRSMVLMLWLLIIDHMIVGLFTDMIQSPFFNTVIWWLMLGLIANAIDVGRDSKVSSQSKQLQTIG